MSDAERIWWVVRLAYVEGDDKDAIAVLGTEIEKLKNKAWQQGCANGTQFPWKEDMGR